jgi:hypothetical protein
MAKQYERAVDIQTGETIDRELTSAEIAALSNAIPEHAKTDQ